MPTHLYKVGAFVSLEIDGQSARAAGRYVVEAQMPPLGTALQYRIKSEAESFRRVVVEHRLGTFGAESISQSRLNGSPHQSEAD